MSYPKISIVTPSYNQGQFLEEAIQSVLSQGYPDLEYIIIDGGSTDNSTEIIKKYASRLAFWVSEKDKGQSDALNKGFRKATGDVLAWLNSDDIYNPGALLKVGEYFASHPDCRFLTGDGEYVGPDGKEHWYYYKAAAYSRADLFHTCKGIRLLQPSVFFSKDTLVEAGCLETGLYYAMDLDLWLRISKRHKLHYLPLCIAKLRRHEGAKTRSCAVESVEKEIGEVIERNLKDIDMLNRVFVKNELNNRKAKTLLRNGLTRYFTGDRPAAVELLKQAVKVNPGAVFSQEGVKLFTRLVLPGSLKKVLLKRP